jgi:ppGpp synthetase/RelA/SpoT-type nucleotidyltranferase
MTEAEFLERWRAEMPLYAAWGDFVLARINERLAAAIAPTALDYFIKVPVKPRLKAENTLVDKAFHRNKGYADPYVNITDKVGMRFVVLLTGDITKVCSVIESLNEFWLHSKDRDYEAERLEKPLEFSYQSMHYIVKAATNFNHYGITIPTSTPCEIQVRTLLQHAHSELTHDTLYKPKTTAKPGVKRTIAKSMALIEATDDFFAQAMDSLNSVSATQTQLLRMLEYIYVEGVGSPAGIERSNQLVIDALAERLPAGWQAAISELFRTKSFIFDRVKARRESNHIFRQPVVLLAYYLANTMPEQTKEIWPLDSADLALVFSDLGKNFEN